MARSYVLNHIHCVFSTKQRRPIIPEPEGLWAYVRGIARNCHYDLLAIGGTKNHVHLLLTLPSGRNLSDVMRDIKANSSRHLRIVNRAFAWQDGYAGVSVSPSQVPVVSKYVQNQEQHHQKVRFEDEYLGLLQRAGAQFDLPEVFG